MTDRQKTQLRNAALANAELAKKMLELGVYPQDNRAILQKYAKELATTSKAQLKILGNGDA